MKYKTRTCSRSFSPARAATVRSSAPGLPTTNGPPCQTHLSPVWMASWASSFGARGGTKKRAVPSSSRDQSAGRIEVLFARPFGSSRRRRCRRSSTSGPAGKGRRRGGRLLQLFLHGRQVIELAPGFPPSRLLKSPPFGVPA